MFKSVSSRIFIFTNSRLFVGMVILILSGTNALAEVYKWVDEKGNVHYGDKLPDNKPATTIESKKSNQSNHADQTIQNFFSIKTAKTNSPIRNTDPDKNRSVELQRVFIDIESKSVGMHTVGQEFYGLSCTQKQNRLTVPHGRKEINAASFRETFKNVLSEFSYQPFSSNNDDIFEVNRDAGGELILGAVIKELQLNICRNTGSRGKAAMRSYMRIAWQLYDPLEREVIYRTETEGSDAGQYEANGVVEEYINRQNAFSNALKNLLSQADFVSKITKQSPNPVSQLKTNRPFKLALSFGDNSGSFLKNVDVLKTATVTIRSTIGHGSGFLIDADGYLLTNEHVVGGSEYVMVIIGEEKFRADVVRTHKARDVALLKLENKVAVTPLVISRKNLLSGESVYVVGTPFDEALSHTVTKGIISATRSDDHGMRFYQTDASVNPGNSGGPAFNDAGEVIGIAVSSLVNKTGSSVDINFLIPIDHALEVLQVSN